MAARKTRVERSWLLVLFGLVFFLAGTLLFAFQGVPAILDALQMRGWPDTQATLTAAKLEVHHGDSTTYSISARYHYDVDGLRYENDRVAIMGGADNIGDFQQSLGRRLEEAFAAGRPVTAWYDPNDPAESVLNRDLRWGMLGFFGIFLLAFGGVGAGIMFWALRGHRVIDVPEAAQSPWLANPDWQDGRIRSSARGGMVFTWCFAALWNLISLPLAFLLPSAWEDEGPIVLLFLLFPIVGIWLFTWALSQTRQWRRFGVTELTMDPYPGSVGGDVGGEVAVNLRWDPATVFNVTLTCLHSRMSGSGKNRSRRETVVWQDSGIAEPTVAGEGIRLRFRFAVPEGLPLTEEKDGGAYHLWRLSLHASIPGVDLDRNFEIPVYATGERSGVRVRAIGGSEPGDVQLRVEDLLPMQRLGDQVLIRYPAWRNPLRNAMIIAFGGVFVTIGGVLPGLAGGGGFMLGVMSAVFVLVGGLVVLAGLFALTNSLEILCDGSYVTSVRRVFGFPVSRRQAAYYEITDIRATRGFSSTTPKRTLMEYSVNAETPDGMLVLAEHLDSHSAVETVRAFFGEVLNVPIGKSAYDREFPGAVD